MLTEDGSLPFNRLFLVGPKGVLGSLPKQHLFAFWQEDSFYQGGQAEPLIRTPHGPVGGLVCYDLRFPETARRQVFAGSRLLAVSAQWPLTRLDHWQTLVRARAIENQVYVVAANGCGLTGTDGNGRPFDDRRSGRHGAASGRDRGHGDRLSARQRAWSTSSAAASIRLVIDPGCKRTGKKSAAWTNSCPNWP